MNNNIYCGDFDSKQDLENLFDVKLGDDINILFALYETGYYDGSAYVVFERAEKLFMVQASHCSCYGLEGQWDEEETSLTALKYMYEKGSIFGFYDDGPMKEIFGEMLNRLGEA